MDFLRQAGLTFGLGMQCNNPSQPLIFETYDQNLDRLLESNVSTVTGGMVQICDKTITIYQTLQRSNPEFTQVMEMNQEKCGEEIKKFYRSPDDIDRSFMFNLLVNFKYSPMMMVNVNGGMMNFSGGPQSDILQGRWPYDCDSSNNDVRGFQTRIFCHY